MTRRRVVVVAAAAALAGARVGAQPPRGLPRVAILSHSVPLAEMIGPPLAGQPLWGAETEQAARLLGLSLSVAAADGPDDFDAAFAAIARDRPHAMLCVDTPANVGSRQRIVEFAAGERLPAVYAQRLFVDAGGLLSYGADLIDLARRAAAYVDKLLRGARAGDLPIEQPTRFELAVNQRAARLLGLPMPPRLLLRADTVIE